MNSNLILPQSKVDQIISRIAYQIHENNMDETVLLVGVDNGGRRLADQLNETLFEISGHKSKTYTINLDKEDPLLNDIEIEGYISDFENSTVVLCDDVLNTGRTLSYCLAKLLAFKVHKVETAVLVLRSHAKFPVFATYIGYELSTTIKEHVEVRTGEGVFLS